MKTYTIDLYLKGSNAFAFEGSQKFSSKENCKKKILPLIIDKELEKAPTGKPHFAILEDGIESIFYIIAEHVDLRNLIKI